MIKRIFTYMAALLILAGCSDDFEPQTPGRLDSDGTLHLSFGISPMRRGLTRSSDAVSDVTMYVYDANGSKLQISPVVMTGDLTGQVLLNSSVIEEGSNAKFYFVANATEMEGNGNSLTALNGATFSAWENGDGGLTMSSKAVSIVNAQQNTVALYHNAAKITVNNAVEDKNDAFGYKAGTTAYSFVPQGTAIKSPVMAGGLNAASESAGLGSHSTSNLPKTLSSDEQFVHSTDNTTTGNANKSWVIVQASYGEENYYYRLDFQQKVEKKPATTPPSYETKAINVRPNHHYEFLIKSIKGPGYKTIEEAADNPTPMLDYVIHDHAPVIYNMISDGSRELGVSKELTRETSSTGQEFFYVKLFSPTGTEMAEILDEENWENIFGIDVAWLKVADVKEFTSDDLGEGESMDDYMGDTGIGVDDKGNTDTNSTGRLFKVWLEFSNTNNPGTLSTSVNVSWHGLSRSVDIKWIREFNTESLFSPAVEIQIHEGANETWKSSGYHLHNSDYFNDFLKNEVLGVKTDDNNGQPRDNGLHFPMPYGNGDKWTYIYKLTLNRELGGGGNFEWDISATGISHVKILIPSGSHKNQDDRVFYVTRSSGDQDFSYEKGKLLITITTSEGTITYDNVALYHTGFFHWDNVTSANDNSSDNSGNSNNKDYLSEHSSHPQKRNYYEVVTVGGEHWLDRNMGAASAQSHIEGGMENPQAQGYYMAAGYYWQYNSPIIFKNSVPPGYEVPSVEQWNNLKNASNFNIEQVGSYYYPTLRVGDKEVYFPKGRYYNGSVKQGENRAGYYWTRDAATGTEKDETGNWLKCMQFAGTSSSYINGCTMGRNGVSPYYMSLRAVAKSNGNENHPDKFYFLVTGATHVYLYKGEGKDRVAAYTWPGKAIGNYSTASKTFSFSYETTTSNLDELKVIFNYVDQYGQIHTYSNNAFDGTFVTHTNITSSEARGWTVWNSNKSSDFSKEDCGVSISGTLNGMKSTNGTTWTIDSPIPEVPFTPSTFRILWPTGTNYKYIRIKDKNGNVLNNWTERTDEAYEYNYNGTTKWSWSQYTASATQLKFEFASTNSNPSTIYVPDPDKIYTNSDLQELTGHGASGIIITKLKSSTSVDPQVNNNFRILWPKTEGYKYIWIGTGNNTNQIQGWTDGTSRNYNGTDYYCYDLTTTNSSLWFRFSKSSDGSDAITPKPNSAYSLSGYTTEWDGKRVVTVSALDIPQSGGDSYTCRIYWAGNSTFYQWGPSGLPTGGTGNITSDVSGYSCYEFTLNATEMAKQYNYHYNGKGEMYAQGTMFEVFGNSTSAINCAYIDSDNTLHKQSKPSANVDKRQAIQDGTPSGKRCVFWDNDGKNWSTVKIHYWGGSSSTTWPGEDMTQINGTNYWYAYIPDGSTGVIFHNNSGTQTDDVSLRNNGTITDNTYKDGDDKVSMK